MTKVDRRYRADTASAEAARAANQAQITAPVIYTRPMPVAAAGEPGTLTDGDKGDIVVSNSGATFTIDSAVLSTAGRSLINDANVAAMRTTLELGTAAQSASTDFATAGHDHSGVYEPAGTVATHAAVTQTHGISAFGATLVDDASASVARGTLGLGTAATRDADTFQSAMGFPLTATGVPAATVTYDKTTRKVTVTAVSGGTFDLFVNGTRITTNSPYVSAAHDATTNNHFLYHDGSNFVWATAVWDLMLHTPVCLVYYNATTSDGVGYRETHTISRDPAMHRRLHEVEGTALVSGGVLADWVADTDTDAACTFSISEAVIADEDLHSTVAALADGGPYTVWHRDGADGTWTWTTGLSFPFTAGTYPQYNKNTAGTWSLADLSSGNFGTFYVLATPSVTSGHGLIIIPGQQDFTTLALANADSFAALSVGALPIVEFCVIAKVVVEAKSAYTNVYNAVIKSITRLTASRSLSTSSPPTQHNTLNGLQGGAPGSSDYYHLTAVEYAALHPAVTVADSTSVDLTLTGQQISAAAIFGTSAGTVCQGDDARLSDARTPTSHSHAQSDVTNLTTDLAAKQPDIQFQDDGTNRGTAGGVSTVNFTGAGVTATESSGTLSVSIPGGAGEAFPVGSVFISVVSTNPGTLLGYGTWAAFGAGRVLVGLDSADTDFDTVEETGGAKTKAISAHSGTAVADHAAHTHSVTSNVAVGDHASHTHTYTEVPNHVHPFTINSSTTDGTWASFDSSTTAGTARNFNTSNPTGGVATATTNGPSATLTHSVTNNAVTSADPSATLTHSVTQPSAHTDLNVVQPYIVAYFWKRTA